MQCHTQCGEAYQSAPPAITEFDADHHGVRTAAVERHTARSSRCARLAEARAVVATDRRSAARNIIGGRGGAVDMSDGSHTAPHTTQHKTGAAHAHISAVNDLSGRRNWSPSRVSNTTSGKKGGLAVPYGALYGARG